MLDKKILSKIQEDILNPEIALSSVLLAAKVLAHKLNNQELGKWIRCEMDGYRYEDRLPDYRNFKLLSKGTFSDGFQMVRNQIIPITLLSAEWLKKQVTSFPVTHGIRIIEEFSNVDNLELKFAWENELVFLLNREEIFNMNCLEAFFVTNPAAFAQILQTVRSRLLDFILELDNIEWNIGNSSLPTEQVQRLVDVTIFNHTTGGNMSLFDQREQKVNNQYNAAGNINIEGIQSQTELVNALERINNEIAKARLAGEVDEDCSIDAEYQVKKAIQAVKKTKTDKTSFLTHIGKAKELLEDATAATGLVRALIEVAKIARSIL